MAEVVFCLVLVIDRFKLVSSLTLQFSRTSSRRVVRRRSASTSRSVPTASHLTKVSQSSVGRAKTRSGRSWSANATWPTPPTLTIRVRKRATRAVSCRRASEGWCWTCAQNCAYCTIMGQQCLNGGFFSTWWAVASNSVGLVSARRDFHSCGLGNEFSGRTVVDRNVIE